MTTEFPQSMTVILRPRYVYFLVLFIAGAGLMAQSDTTPLSSDRPTQTASAFLVPKGAVQIETGFSWINARVDISSITSVDLDVITYNSTQLRFGLFENVELLFSQSVMKTRVSDANSSIESGVEWVPSAIGARIHLSDIKEDGKGTQASFLATLSGPLLSENFEGSEIDLRFNMQKNLGSMTAIGYSLGGIMDGEFDTFTGLFSIVMNRATSERLSFFAELYFFFPDLADTVVQSDFGLLYRVSPNFQVDIFGGVGISESTPDSLFGAGLSLRIPRK